MGMLDPLPPPYDPLEWLEKPFAERGRLACQAWAIQGYGTPLGVYVVYLLKIAFYIGMWVWFCGFSPELGGFATLADWWLHPLAFQKAIVWSLLFEIVGLGCGSGPLTGRYNPPIGGFLYFLRPGTTKLAAFEKAPLIGGYRRSFFDVLVYAGLLVALVLALIAPELGVEQLAPIAVLLFVAGILDKTLFLIARGEHYWTTIIVFIFAGSESSWIAGAIAVQLALWFWAGVSKLNPHFPAVVCVMTSNSPISRMAWLRKLMYRSYPDDLRPSRLAGVMAHFGTALELGVPAVLLASTFVESEALLITGLVLMLVLHVYITSNVPMGVPIEWNFMVVYGGFALFWAHPDASLLDLGSIPLAVFLVVALVVIPLLGNLFPAAISFLLAMRYYAGNWATSIWLFRGDTYRKLDKLTKTTPWVYDQLEKFYPHSIAVGVVSKVMAFRLMHLHGRALPILVPKAVERFEDYEYVDGEIVAGMALGWNFGEGHLHGEQLLRALQSQCDFEEGELRCIFLESQPLHRLTQAWKIYDAKAGLIAEGEVSIAEMVTRQPWEAPASAG